MHERSRDKKNEDTGNKKMIHTKARENRYRRHFTLSAHNEEEEEEEEVVVVVEEEEEEEVIVVVVVDGDADAEVE